MLWNLEVKMWWETEGARRYVNDDIISKEAKLVRLVQREALPKKSVGLFPIRLINRIRISRVRRCYRIFPLHMAIEG